LSADYLTIAEVRAIHDAEVARTDEDDEVLNYSYLEAAVARPKTELIGGDTYPSVEAKAAAYVESLACNHAFVEGNKRTAAVVMIVFLERNGLVFDAANDDLFEFVRDVSLGREGPHDFDSIERWIQKHTAPASDDS
jgi:death-on-curing protein